MPLKVDLALGKLAVDEGVLPSGSLQSLLEAQRQQESQGMYRPLGDALVETQAADGAKLDALLVKLRRDVRVRMIQHLGKQLVEEGITHNVALRSAMRGMRRELTQGKQASTGSLLNYLDAVGGIEGELDRAALGTLGDRFFAALDYGKLFEADGADTLALRVAYQRGMASEEQIFAALWAARAGGEAAAQLPGEARQKALEILQRAGKLGAPPAGPQETVALPAEPAAPAAPAGSEVETVIVSPEGSSDSGPAPAVPEVPTVGLANIPDLPTLDDDDAIGVGPEPGVIEEDDDEDIVEEITGASFDLPDLDLGGGGDDAGLDESLVPPTIISAPPQAPGGGAFADEAEIDTFREAVPAADSGDGDLDFTPMPTVDHGPLDLASAATQALPSHKPAAPAPGPGATQPLPSALPRPSALPTPDDDPSPLRGGRGGLGRGGGATDRLPGGQRTGRPMSSTAGRRMTPAPSGSRHQRPHGRRRDGGANPLVIAAVVVAVLAVASLMIVGLTGDGGSGGSGGDSATDTSSDAAASSKAALEQQLTQEKLKVSEELKALAVQEDFARAQAVYQAFAAKVEAAKLGEGWEEQLAGLQRVYTGAQMARYNELVDQFKTAIGRALDADKPAAERKREVQSARELLTKIRQICPEIEVEQLPFLEEQLADAERTE